MARFLSLHEAPPPNQGLCEKYDVPSYDDYKAWARTEGRQNYEAYKRGERRTIGTYPEMQNASPLQKLAFSIVCCIAITNKKPSYLVLNSEIILEFVAQDIEVPYTFEEVPIVYDKSGIASIAWIL